MTNDAPQAFRRGVNPTAALQTTASRRVFDVPRGSGTPGSRRRYARLNPYREQSSRHTGVLSRMYSFRYPGLEWVKNNSISKKVKKRELFRNSCLFDPKRNYRKNKTQTLPQRSPTVPRRAVAEALELTMRRDRSYVGTSVPQSHA